MADKLKPRLGWVVSLAGGILFISILNVSASFWVIKFLEKKARYPIKGIFFPHPFYPSFSLENSSFNWQDKFQVHSGVFQVDYNPFYLLWHKKFRTQIKGRDVGVQILGRLAESEGFSEVKVDRVDADLAFPREGTVEIFSFDVQSKQLELHLTRRGGELDKNPVKKDVKKTENLT